MKSRGMKISDMNIYIYIYIYIKVACNITKIAAKEEENKVIILSFYSMYCRWLVLHAWQ